MDLLSAVSHEMGPALGLGDLGNTGSADAPMTEDLAQGIQPLSAGASAGSGTPGRSSWAASGSGKAAMIATPNGRRTIRISDPPRQAEALDAVLLDSYADRSAGDPLHGLLARVKRGRS
jgi:hypothetical protein